MDVNRRYRKERSSTPPGPEEPGSGVKDAFGTLRKAQRAFSNQPGDLSPGDAGSLAFLFSIARAALLLLVPCAVAQTLTVTHIRPESEADLRNAYFIRVLDLVLAKTEGPYRLAAHSTVPRLSSPRDSA